ncbi:MAG: tol-pal system protein YbgF [Paracoccaceae bacterium]|jgi:tol-pal system protein YbgF
MKLLCFVPRSVAALWCRPVVLVSACLLSVFASHAPVRAAETLADIRQELSVLFVEVQKLKRELSTTGGAQSTLSGGSALARIDAIESELQNLTSKTEDLGFRIERIVQDGTNRIGDLEFRLVELEGGDLGALGKTTTLGGVESETSVRPATGSSQTGTGGAQMAMSEQSDFDRAKGAFDSGNFRSAADLFTAFTQTYPGGPLTGPAHFYRGEALSGLGEPRPAARAYLESFSGAPDSDVAPTALLRLGTSLNELGQVNEACVTLGEVQVRFPQADAAFEAGAARRSMGCS